MNPDDLRQVLRSIRDGELEVDDALDRLAHLPFQDVGEAARIDHHRALRCGFPEVIYCEGKDPDDVASIARTIVGSGTDLLATRADEPTVEALLEAVPDATHHARARAVTRRAEPGGVPTGHVLIISAGTTDVPVAEEARVTAELMGARVETLYDVGVAGIHRLLAQADDLRKARVLVVAAGMEGALPSVVGGLVARPVIAVPTSTGYGAAFEGLAALLGMLNTCASGVTVVNIDNGFGAGYAAALMNGLPAPEEPPIEGDGSS